MSDAIQASVFEKEVTSRLVIEKEHVGEHCSVIKFCGT